MESSSRNGDHRTLPAGQAPVVRSWWPGAQLLQQSMAAAVGAFAQPPEDLGLEAPENRDTSLDFQKRASLVAEYLQIRERLQYTPLQEHLRSGFSAAGRTWKLAKTRAKLEPFEPIDWVQRALDVVTCGRSSHSWTRLGNIIVRVVIRKGRPSLQAREENPTFFVASRLRWIAMSIWMCMSVVVVAAHATRRDFLPFSGGTTDGELFWLLGEDLTMGAMCVFAFVSLLLWDRQTNLRVLGLSGNELPLLMPLLLTPSGGAAEFMLSYTWGDQETAPYVLLARSLAAVLPRAWVDTMQLASGDAVSLETMYAAANCRILVILLSPCHLKSVNCTKEVIAALRHRVFPALTYVLMEQAVWIDNPIFPIVSSLMLRAGFYVCPSVACLLRALDAHALHTDPGHPEDSAACVTWWARYGLASRSAMTPNTVVLPVPMVPRMWVVAMRYASCCPGLFRRGTEVKVGFTALRGDALESRPARYPSLIEVVPRCFAAFLAAMLVGVAAITVHGSEHTIYDWFWMGLQWVFTGAVVFFYYLVTPKIDFASCTDTSATPLCIMGHVNNLPRWHLLEADVADDASTASLLRQTTHQHSLPLIRGSVVSAAQVEKLASFQVCIVGHSNMQADWTKALQSITAFLGPTGGCGVSVCVADLLVMAELCAEPTPLTLYFFVLDSTEAARAWLKLTAWDAEVSSSGGRRWLPSCMVIVVDNSVPPKLQADENELLFDFLLILHDVPKAFSVDTLARDVISALARKVPGVIEAEQLHMRAAVDDNL